MSDSMVIVKRVPGEDDIIKRSQGSQKTAFMCLRPLKNSVLMHDIPWHCCQHDAPTTTRPVLAVHRLDCMLQPRSLAAVRTMADFNYRPVSCGWQWSDPA